MKTAVDLHVRVKSVYLASTHHYKRLKGGKQLSRIRRCVKAVTTEVRPKQDAVNGINLIIEVRDRQFTGRLEGVLCKKTGTISFAVVDSQMSSYLKKKRFNVIGYELEARQTNLNRRKT